MKICKACYETKFPNLPPPHNQALAMMKCESCGVTQGCVSVADPPKPEAALVEAKVEVTVAATVEAPKPEAPKAESKPAETKTEAAKKPAPSAPSKPKAESER
jgi:hypothetical protein